MAAICAAAGQQGAPLHDLMQRVVQYRGFLTEQSRRFPKAFTAVRLVAAPGAT